MQKRIQSNASGVTQARLANEASGEGSPRQKGRSPPEIEVIHACDLTVGSAVRTGKRLRESS